MHYYLVKNIKVNNNQPYRLQLPAVYSDYGDLAKPYLRTFAFQFKEVTFDYTHIHVSYDNYTTEKLTEQSYIPDLVDILYDDSHIAHSNNMKVANVEVLPMPKTSMIVAIPNNEFDWYVSKEEDITDYVIRLAIFMQLTIYLELDFFIKHLSLEDLSES